MHQRKNIMFLTSFKLLFLCIASFANLPEAKDEHEKWRQSWHIISSSQFLIQLKLIMLKMCKHI